MAAGLGTEPLRPGEAGSSAERLRRLRDRLGLSQEQLARRLGVSFATVNRWESGRTRMSERASRALADFEARTEQPEAGAQPEAGGQPEAGAQPGRREPPRSRRPSLCRPVRAGNGLAPVHALAGPGQLAAPLPRQRPRLCSPRRPGSRVASRAALLARSPR